MSTTVLVVEDDKAMQRSLVRMLSNHDGLRIETADDGYEGFQAAQRLNPDLIVSDYNMPGMNGFELCTKIKSDPELSHSMFVVLTGYSDTKLKITGLDLGVDDYLTKPVEAPEFLAKIRSVLRTKSLHDEIRADRAELQVLHDSLSESFDRLLHTITHILGLKVSGAAERGDHLARHAMEIARRMEIPEEYLPDLGLAARLHELGRLIEPEAQESVTPWHYLQASDLALKAIDQLRPVADLVIAIGEHWDGSGQPRHLVHGQIPLRSRILRTLIDLFKNCVDESMPTAEALDRLARFAGTRYDPLVVTHVVDTFGERESAAWLPDSLCIPLSELVDGMVLAKDLITSSGIKLLSRGAAVTSNTIELINQRNTNDPIVYGAWIQKRS